ncbi:hypothetical protein I4B36_001054 [Enterobacter hormaechei]|nr:hypothetical protein [Enterobacter hormaechei]
MSDEQTNETINARAGLTSNFYFGLPDGFLKMHVNINYVLEARIAERDYRPNAPGVGIRAVVTAIYPG